MVERLVIYMNKKLKKMSINSVIYLLLVGMFAAIIAVSIFTVASRRKPINPDTVSTDESAEPIDSSNVGGNNSDSNDTNQQNPDTETDTKEQVNDSETLVKDTDKPASLNNDENSEDLPASNEIKYFVLPVVGSVAKNFEIDIPVYSLTMNDYRAHTGIDISAPLGSEVVASSTGIVCAVNNDPLMGKCITIDHGDNVYTIYKNLNEEIADNIEVGSTVTMGQTIGAVGQSAIIEIAEEPHLHFEMKVDGLYADPLEYMSSESQYTEYYED